MSFLVSVEEDCNYFIHLVKGYICVCRQENALAKLILDTKNLKDARVNDIGSTFLHVAANAGNVEIVNYLLGLGVNVNVQDDDGDIPLMVALDVLDKARDKEDIDIIDISIVDILVTAGSNVYLYDNYKFNAFEYVLTLEMPSTTEKTRNVMKIIKLFLERLKKDYGNDSELMAKILMDNEVPLERYIFLNNPDVTRAMIVRYDEPVDEPHPETGTTALHAAVNLMSLENVKALIELGADVYAEDRQGLTPLQYYCKTDYYNTAAKDSEESEIVRIMMKNIDDVNKQSHGRFIVQTVACRGNEEAVKILLQYELDFHVLDDSGNTLLYYFATNIYTNVVKLLKGSKLDLTFRGTQGSMMLMAAVANANLNTVRFLLEGGADPNSITERFSVPVLVTALRSFRARRGLKNIGDCILLLLEHGARVQWLYHTPIFSVLQMIPNSNFIAKKVFEHLAIDEVSGKSITDDIRRQIASKSVAHRNFFDERKRHLEEMSKVIVYRSFTMLMLLSENEESILRRYAYNQEFLEKLESMNEENGPFLYYDRLLHNRVARMIPRIKMIRKTAPIVCDMIGETRNMDSIVVRKIISYLDFFDMQMINKLE